MHLWEQCNRWGGGLQGFMVEFGHIPLKPQYPKILPIF